MLHQFMMIVPVTGHPFSTYAPLDAGTLLDMQVFGVLDGFVDSLPFYLDNRTFGLKIDGVEVLPENFPLRWLMGPQSPSPDTRGALRFPLNCHGRGARIEVRYNASMPPFPPIEELQAGQPDENERKLAIRSFSRIMVVFRYLKEESQYTEPPFTFHVFSIQGEETQLQRGKVFARIGNLTTNDAILGVAVDWTYDLRKGPTASGSNAATTSPTHDNYLYAQYGGLLYSHAGMKFNTDAPTPQIILANGNQWNQLMRLPDRKYPQYIEREPIYHFDFLGDTTQGTCLDMLDVQIGGNTYTTETVPLGVVRPSERQSLERSLYRVPAKYGASLHVDIEQPYTVRSYTMQQDGKKQDSPLDGGLLYHAVVVSRKRQRRL